jgi:hypothetical protein
VHVSASAAAVVLVCCAGAWVAALNPCKRSRLSCRLQDNPCNFMPAHACQHSHSQDPAMHAASECRVFMQELFLHSPPQPVTGRSWLQPVCCAGSTAAGNVCPAGLLQACQLKCLEPATGLLHAGLQIHISARTQSRAGRQQYQKAQLNIVCPHYICSAIVWSLLPVQGGVAQCPAVQPNNQVRRIFLCGHHDSPSC